MLEGECVNCCVVISNSEIRDYNGGLIIWQMCTAAVLCRCIFFNVIIPIAAK